MLNWLCKLRLSIDRTNSSIVQLLLSDPQGWTFDEHYARHAATNIAIWTANKDYGLHVELDDERIHLKTFEARMIWVAVKPVVEQHKQRRLTKIDRIVAKYLTQKEAA